MAALVSAASRAEPLSNLSISDVTVTEGGSPNATFTVSLDAPSGVDVTFDYATADFTASAGEDYADTSGLATIPAGATEAVIPVPVLNDSLDELEETFTVTLSGAVGGGLDDAEGLGTITDNDAAPQVSIGNATDRGRRLRHGRGHVRRHAERAERPDRHVDYSTTDGTATSRTTTRRSRRPRWCSLRARPRSRRRSP